MSTKTDFLNEGKTPERLPKFVEYHKIPYMEEFPEILGKDGYYFEKIDGALCQVRNISQGLLGGSKSNYLIGDRTKASWFPKFLKWMRSGKSLNNLPKNLILFGEWLDPVTIDYDSDKLDKFYFIDLAHIDNDKPIFYDYLEASNYLKNWGIEGIKILPPLAKGEFTNNTINNLIETRSFLRDGKKEGLVLKDYDRQLFAKILNPEYSEIREQEKTLEEKYINRPRVKKALVRLRDESGIFHPSLDILAEEVARDIKIESEHDFDLRAVKGVIRIRRFYTPNALKNKPYSSYKFKEYRRVSNDKTVQGNFNYRIPEEDRGRNIARHLTRNVVNKAFEILDREHHIKTPSAKQISTEVGRLLFGQKERFNPDYIKTILRRKKLL